MRATYCPLLRRDRPEAIMSDRSPARHLSKVVGILADLRPGKQLQGAEIPLLWA
jgi:hypothetical protein